MLAIAELTCTGPANVLQLPPPPVCVGVGVGNGSSLLGNGSPTSCNPNLPKHVWKNPQLSPVSSVLNSSGK